MPTLGQPALPASTVRSDALAPFGRDLPPAPGVTLVEDGADVAIYAGHADAVELCLFDAGDATGASERRLPLRERAHGWWFGFAPGMGVGTRYGFRVDGPWRPEEGLRHDPAKLLVDPYARALEGGVSWGPEVFGTEIDPTTWAGESENRSGLDSAAHMPRSVVIDDTFDWEDDRPPRHRLSETVIYETHVVNLTRLRPGIPPELRGTYAGLAHPDTLAHLTDLGVTAVELLPIHAFTHEPALVRRGLTNHWGYNTLAFLAPHAPYAAARDPQGVVNEVKGMVKLAHRAGLEVILDVVYNHTAEQGADGATLCYRGLDNRAYYRLDERGWNIDVTGCGNTLDLRHPVVCRLVLDSLRRWVLDYHVDGFRFDLAVALGRGRGDDFDPDHPFLIALRTDPVLCQVKLIAEPWDVGMHGWRTGQFPPPFSEWNDIFRNSLRQAWLVDQRAQRAGETGLGLRDVATRLAGSRDTFGARDRGPMASINYVAAHDGFTVADLTAYDHKHNEANGEGNADGSNGARSWNHGVEGPTEDSDVLADRRRAMRNLLGCLLLSAGVPMLNGGDEFGRTQQGNNNPYCQDNEISWYDWDWSDWQHDLHETTRRLIALRHDHPALRQRTWALGRQVHDDGSVDLEWFDAAGERMADWDAGPLHTLQMLVNGAWVGAQSVLVVLHAGSDAVEVTLPTPPGLAAYRLLWDSSWERPREPGPLVAAGPVTVAGASMQCYVVDDPT